MASSSVSLPQQGAGGAPPPAADDALLAPQLNPEFAAMPATALVAYLKRNPREDNFRDAALVLAERERRLALADDLVRASHELMVTLQGKVRALRAEKRALQLRIANAEARAWQARKGGVGHGHVVPPRPRYRALRMHASTSSELQALDDDDDDDAVLVPVVPRPSYKALRMNASPPGYPYIPCRSFFQAPAPQVRVEVCACGSEDDSEL